MISDASRPDLGLRQGKPNLPAKEDTMRKYFAPICAALLLCGGVASAQDTPREIIQRSIKAHGGEEKLARITCDKVKVQGVLHIGDDNVPFSAETFVQLPGQFKNTVNLTVND